MRGRKNTEKWNVVIEAQSTEQMEQRFSKLGPDTLSRKTGVRSNESTELWTIRKYLSIRLQRANISFPLNLQAGDRPDFRLQEGEAVAGVEVTVATHQGTQIAYQQAEELGLTQFSVCALARENSSIPIKANAIRNHLQDLNAPQAPYYGSEVEDELFALLNGAIKKKLVALNKTDFERFPSNYLLIYENSGLPCILWDKVDILRLRSSNTNHSGCRFDKIIVLSNGDLIEVA